MSEIKSYLSIQSLPYQQYKTPSKNHFGIMPTNPSLAFSQSLGFNYSKDQTRRTLFNSTQMPNYYQLQEYPLRQNELENNSSITLNPIITKMDMQELINSAKMVAFLTKETNAKMAYINQKQIIIQKLIVKRNQIEQKVKKRKNEYTKKQKQLSHRSLSAKTLQRSKSITTVKEITFMKREILTMKKTLSMKKIEKEFRRKEELNNNRRQRTNTNNNFRDRRKVYIPITKDGRDLNRFQQLPHSLSNQIDMQLHHNRKLEHYKYQPSSVLGLLSNALSQGDPMVHLSNFKMKILKEEEKKLIESASRLQYFDKPLLEQNQKSKSEIRRSRQTSMIRNSNKWKENDKQDSEMISLIEQSIKCSQTSLHIPKQKEQTSQYKKKAQKRSENKIKDSHIIDQSKNITFTLPENSRDKSKIQQNHNNSHVNIELCLNQSEQKRNQSMQSNRIKSPDKRIIVQSSVNIMMHDQESPLKNQSKIQRSQSKYPPLPKQITKIEQQPDIELPIESKIIGSEQHSVESRFTQTQRQTKQTKKVQNRMEASEVYSQTHVISLKQPPSLSISDKYEDEDDFMNSIKLNSQSRLSRQSPHSKSSLKVTSQMKNQIMEDQDEIFGIKLIAQSKISRQREHSIKGSNSFEEQQEKAKKQSPKMTRSEQKIITAYSEDNAEDNQLNALRSSTSSIVKHGTIKKSINWAPRGHLKSNSTGSQQFKLSMKDLLSQPIQQAEQDEQLLSNIYI